MYFVMRNFVTGTIVLLFLSSISCTDTEKGDWTRLYNGKNLDGFVQRGGEAKFEASGKMIVGTTVANTPNSFLCTEKEYDNFIMEAEVLVDTFINSGIQIRSQSDPEYRDGRVHGYQVEIDPSPRSYSGGIYDEARRGWLYDLRENEAGRNAFVNHEWNRYRIEAIDSSIKVWINGVQTANLVDEWNDRGFIAFQVHGINAERAPWTEGLHVRWRDIRIMTEDLEAHRTKPGNDIEVRGSLVNALLEQEKQNGWKLLFDGETTRGWRGAGMDHFPEKGWQAGNGTLTVVESGGSEAEFGGDIVTVDEYGDFELYLEFKFTPGANSGIKYYVTEEEKTSGSAIGPEYQILDDERHPDAKKGREGNRTLASLYDLIPAENKRLFPEWQQVRIVSGDGHVEHWLNGRKVLEYERGSGHFRELVARSKYSKWDNFGEAEKGHILLQDHGNRVSFRSIRIREL